MSGAGANFIDGTYEMQVLKTVVKQKRRSYTRLTVRLVSLKVSPLYSECNLNVFSESKRTEVYNTITVYVFSCIFACNKEELMKCRRREQINRLRIADISSVIVQT